MKREFEVQRYYLKWLCSAPLLFVALALEFFISQHTKSNMVFYLSCALVMGGLLTAYYMLTDRLGMFRTKGYFWEDNGIVFVEIRERQYEIRDVTTLIAEEPNIFLYRYAHLLIETPGQKLKIFGQSLRGSMEFKDSDLEPLFRLILEKSPELTPKKLFDAEVEGWYIKKK